jgi:hypothetical protein
MFGDKGYDSDDYRAALPTKGIILGIPLSKGRLLSTDFDKISTANATESRICSAKLKTGDALALAMIDEHIAACILSPIPYLLVQLLIS